MPDYDFQRRFGSLERLYGDSSINKLSQSSVLIAGIGGVGSWAAEALCRSGVGRIILADLDHVAESNINRQAHALGTTLGQAKVQAMHDRLMDINPALNIELIDDFITPDNALELIQQYSPDVVLDCTDQVQAKIAMLIHCRTVDVEFIMCGGAGGKTDSFSLIQSDLSKVRNDALLGKIRYILRKQYGYPKGSDQQGKALKKVPKMGVACIWLDQKAVLPDFGANTGPASGQTPQGLSCAGYGSVVTITAAMGFAAANQTLNFILAKA